MALTANTANVAILVDTDNKVLVSLLLFQTANGNETDVLKVNVETLSCRTMILSTANVTLPQIGFVAGEKITGNTSGATGVVQTWTASSNTANGTLAVTMTSGTFSNTEVIVGDRLHSNTTINGITTPQRTLSIDQVWFTVDPGATAELAFKNNANVMPMLHLKGTNSFGKNNGFVPIKNKFPVTDGNLYVSTYNVLANGGYSIVLELGKQTGFGAKAPY